MTEANEDALRTARARVAERYTAVYHRNAIFAGDWDAGSLVQSALRDVLTMPDIAEGEE
jgi:hypothetical protein